MDDYNRALEAASETGDLDGARRAVTAGADVNYDPGDGWTGLILAASGGHVEIARLLVEARAELNLQTVRRGVLRRARVRGPAEGTARTRRATAAPR